MPTTTNVAQVKLNVMTQAQYDALDTYDDNAVYMIYEPES